MQEVTLKPKRGSFKKTFALLLAFCMCFSLIQTVPVMAAEAVKSITLNKTTLSLKVGGSDKLIATVTPESEGGENTPNPTPTNPDEGNTPNPTPTNPENGSETSETGLKAAASIAVTWKSDKASVASVASDGTVKGVSAGTAVITASAGGKEAKCTVTVTADTVKDPDQEGNDKPGTTEVKAGTVTLSATKLTVVKGKSKSLKATVGPKGAPQNVTWKSSNTKVATVKNGVVKGIKGGTADITATIANGKKATCKVTVAEVKLSADKMPLQKGKSTTALKVESCYPKNDKVKSWKSSNTKVAAVDKNGKITGKATGKATITVTMKSGATDSCQVTVQKGKVTTKKLTISSKKLTLAAKETAKLTVKRDPISASEKITWTSSKKPVATVDKNGKVTAKKVGTATITAKTSNGRKVTCKVTVKKPTVTLEKTKATIKVGKTTTIKVKSTVPANDKVKSYKSSNTRIATVDKNGKVTGKKAGTARITVTMKSGAKATFTVTVKK